MNFPAFITSAYTNMVTASYYNYITAWESTMLINVIFLGYPTIHVHFTEANYKNVSR